MSSPPSKASAAHHAYVQEEEAPPSYDAAGSSSSRVESSEPLLGGPRFDEPDDAFPPDYKTVVAESSLIVRQRFISKVYSILFFQLLATGALSAATFYSAGFKTWVQTNGWMMWISLIGSIISLIAVYYKRKDYPTNYYLLALFTGLEAYTVAIITSFYDSKIVLEAVVITAVVFAGLTLFALQTKYDFTQWQGILFTSLWILIGAGFISMFFSHGSGFEMVYSVGAVVIFSGYVLVDTQMIMKHFTPDEEVAAAISLYLDIINLFINILRILNNQSNN
ncbi:hypothetical protein H072_7438 [Dactylellina haptotyla CBS 200.50]|uniref:Uncharacterized protein n=1 Tax=Dactylellina haptotyla (strain CBS 200.50) TaxID=1284197 RepID=S8BU32_DACHA|nr:hypothetical protein H072_7438 [Dactylellina haptotyla CBS 200.50]